jgi:hypothetical protein
MKKYLFLIFLYLSISLSSFSQSVGINDFMRLNPYSNFANPAYFVPYNVYVGIPGAANVNFLLYNTGLHYKNLFITNKYGNPKTITPNKFVSKLHKKRNRFNTDANFELLGFGFRVKDYFLSFSYRLRMEENIKYSKDLFGFLFQGNLAQDDKGAYLYTKKSPSVLEFAPNITLYQEMGIGFQGKIFDWLYIGARPKILFGVFNLKTENFNAKVYSNPEDYSIYGNYNVSVNVASVMPFYSKDKNGKINFNMGSLFNFDNNVLKGAFSKNLGFAIDLGAVYRINQQIRVSVSITDLGFIRWKSKPLNMSIKPLANGADYEFSGFTTDQFINFLQNGVTINLDSIVNHNFILAERAPYNTMLTSKIMLDGYFDLTPLNRFIIQFKGFIMGKAFLPQFTIAYNGTFFNMIDVVVSYSMMRKSFANLGVGLGFRLGPAHLYMGTDNVLAPINLFNASKISATFGLLVDLPFKEKVKEAELKSLFKKKVESEENQ